MNFILGILKLLGSLGVFLFGMRVMSDAIQKVAGSRMQSILNYMTINRFVAVLTGFSITALVQSSSATTVMVVSFVNASLLSLTQAIGVIMGANIGTTVTTWIVAFLGFKFKIAAIALPIVGIGLPLIFAKSDKKKSIGEVFIGFGILFLGLAFLKDSVPDIKNNPQTLAFLQNYSNMGYLSYLLFVAIGALLTITVQSSSAAMAITVTMAFKGWIDFPIAASMVLGENIGTTVTAFLASLTANINARRAARAHFLFNVFGVLWMLLVFPLFLSLTLKIAPWDVSIQENLPLNLSLFHTLFNILNTLICIWFIKWFSTIVIRIVKTKKSDESESYRFEYIATTILETPELDIFAAKQEIRKMADLSNQMIQTFLEVFFSKKKYSDTTLKNQKRQERLSDKMQIAINQYLMNCSHAGVAAQTLDNISSMIRIVNELESICDSCLVLSYIIDKKSKKGYSFHKGANSEIHKYSEIVLDLMKSNRDSLNMHLGKVGLKKARKAEDKINMMQFEMTRKTRRRIQTEKGIDVKAELLYIDIIRSFENIGNKSFNISKAQNRMR